MVDTRKARRLCDCRRCVEHMHRLVRADVAAEAVEVPGVRFLQLPGLASSQGSTAEQRSRLDEELRRHPSKCLVGCGCLSCTAHRELAQAWANSLRVQPAAKEKRE